MNIIGAFISRHPSLRRAYKKIGIMYDSYTVFIPRQVRYLQPKTMTAPKKTLLCYPEWPYPCYVLYKICYYNRYKITNRPQQADAVIFFEDKTFRKPDTVLRSLHEKYNIINYYSQDISKKKVDEVHKKVFGYGLSIDPRSYKGKYVKKSDENSLHNYLILDYPEEPQAEYVYQRVVNNAENGEVVDIRIPIIGDTIPIVFLKYRPVGSRFDAGNTRATVKKTHDVISSAEYTKILQFCREMGIDCGELDVLRDNDTQKLYIVDANNTPGGPPLELTKEELQQAIQHISLAFEQTFMDSKKTDEQH